MNAQDTKGNPEILSDVCDQQSNTSNEDTNFFFELGTQTFAYIDDESGK